MAVKHAQHDIALRGVITLRNNHFSCRRAPVNRRDHIIRPHDILNGAGERRIIAFRPREDDLHAEEGMVIPEFVGIVIRGLDGAVGGVTVAGRQLDHCRKAVRLHLDDRLVR